MEINSLQNPNIKNIVKLKKASERNKQCLFIVEGEREINMAQKAGLEIKALYICKKFIKDKEKIKIDNTIQVSANVFSKISYRESPDGYFATFKLTKREIADAKVKENSLIIILESIEKPGNLGAIMRTADAAKIDAVIVNNPKIDIFNHNAIRASQGTIFSTPLFTASIKEILDFCSKNNISIFASSPSAKKDYCDANFRKGTAILLGAEDSGLSEDWLRIVENKIKISMQGIIDSLNLSVSTAIIIFEAKRQRK